MSRACPLEAVDGGSLIATTNKNARAILLGLMVVCIVLVVMVIRPFASALFMGAVLAAAIYPLYNRMVERLKGRRKLSALLITLALSLALVLPVVSLGVVAVRETVAGLDSVHDILAAEGVEGLIRRLPAPLQGRVLENWNRMPRRERNAEFVFNFERRAAATIPRLLNAASSSVVQASFMVIALFFLLLDGSRLVQWVNLVSPLHKRQIRELLEEFRRVSAAVLIGSVVTAAAQAAVALVGYLIARVPNPYFFTLVTFFLGLIPVLGAGGVSMLVAIYLFLSGHLVAAIFLAIWSIFVVGLVDNILKPLLIKGGIEMHGAVVFFVLIGGFTVFGPVGLVLGPLSVTFLLAVLKIYQRDYATPSEETAA